MFVLKKQPLHTYVHTFALLKHFRQLSYYNYVSYHMLLIIPPYPKKGTFLYRRALLQPAPLAAAQRCREQGAGALGELQAAGMVRSMYIIYYITVDGRISYAFDESFFFSSR